jgi:hypothetical protein
MDTTTAIISQIYVAVERMGGNSELLALIGSWGDTLPDEEILECLQMYNERGTYKSKVLFQVGDTPAIRRSRFEVVPKL